MKKVQTWLPVFSGFYGTIWEPDTEREIDYINEQRAAKGFEPIDYNDCDWDNEDYEDRIVRSVTNHVGKQLIELGLIKAYKFEGLVSPREYNFRNDSINVEIVPYKRAISAYLTKHANKFAAYLKETYTSYSGFISSYDNTIEGFMSDKPLEHEHKLGAILNFILLNEDFNEMTIYENVTGNTAGIQATNYEALVNGTEPVKEDDGDIYDKTTGLPTPNYGPDFI